jgi:hypothetical protein
VPSLADISELTTCSPSFATGSSELGNEKGRVAYRAVKDQNYCELENNGGCGRHAWTVSVTGGVEKGEQSDLVSICWRGIRTWEGLYRGASSGSRVP